MINNILKQFGTLIALAHDLPPDMRGDVSTYLKEASLDLVFFSKAQKHSKSKTILEKLASKYNYESDFYFKKNYDLNEGWTAFLDAFRNGKVKSLQDWVKKKRRAKSTKKASVKWFNQIYSDNDGQYKISDIYDYIFENRMTVKEVDVDELAHLNLVPSTRDRYNIGDYPGSPKFIERANNASLTFPIVVVKYDDGMFVADGVHRLWKAKHLGYKKIKAYLLNSQDLKKVKHLPIDVATASKNYINPIDSYCGSDENIAYWEELLDEDGDNSAVEDFLNYIKEIKC